jgi:hypothetical protein
VLETKRTSTVYSAQNRTLAVCCEQISLAYLGKDTKDTINTHGSLYGCTWVEPHLVPRASRGCRRRHAQAAGKAAVHEHTFPTAMSGSSQGLATSCMDSSAMDSDSSTLHHHCHCNRQAASRSLYGSTWGSRTMYPMDPDGLLG